MNRVDPAVLKETGPPSHGRHRVGQVLGCLSMLCPAIAEQGFISHSVVSWLPGMREQSAYGHAMRPCSPYTLLLLQELVANTSEIGLFQYIASN
ncbi:unnamed protein product [Caretta caretta]